MKTDILVLGAGIVGVSAAIHLQDRARSVVLADRGEPGGGTSYGNAGLIERSSVIPYAFPRQLRAIAKYALNSSSDVRYDPAHLPRIAAWLARYWWHSSPTNLGKATQALFPLIEASVSEHDKLIARAGAANLIRERGWVSFYKDPRRFEAARAEAESLSAYGLATRVLERREFLALEPAFAATGSRIAGGVHWLDPKTVTDPQALTAAYANLFTTAGGKIVRADAPHCARRRTAGRSPRPKARLSKPARLSSPSARNPAWSSASLAIVCRWRSSAAITATTRNAKASRSAILLSTRKPATCWLRWRAASG